MDELERKVTKRPFEDEVTVLIVGAGPAGLVLGNLLLAAGVDCLIVERSSRAHVERRARAGYLAAHTVRVLVDNGLGAGLLARGRQHDTCVFRGEQESSPSGTANWAGAKCTPSIRSRNWWRTWWPNSCDAAVICASTPR